jgi:hypothetical protein
MPTAVKSLMNKRLLSIKGTAAIKRTEVNKELARHDDLKRDLESEIKYQAFLASLKAAEDRIGSMPQIIQ